MNSLYRVCTILLLSVACSITATDSVLIMTYVHSRPDFIELHAKTFKAFLKDTYEYVVFNDAPTPAMKQRIEQVCAELGIRCFRVPDHKPHRQTASYRHMDGIQYSLDLLAYNHHGIVAMVDADMFLTKPLCIADYMKNYDFIGGFQSKTLGTTTVTYSSPCLVFMDMRTLPHKRTISFEADRVEGVPVDVGGHLYYYFKNNPTIKLKYYVAASKDGLPADSVSLQQLGFDENTIRFIHHIDRIYGMEFHGDTYFIHYYGGGSNWPSYSAEWIKTKDIYLYTYLNQQIACYNH